MHHEVLDHLTMTQQLCEFALLKNYDQHKY